MLGILGLILLKSTKVANHFKEKVALTLFLKDEVSNEQIFTLKEALKKEDFSKKVLYISKDRAAKQYSKEIGEDFLEFLGTNPIKNAIDIYVKADFVSPGKMEELEARFKENAFVLDVSYDKPLINLLTKNIKRIGFWLLILSSFFGIVAIFLINSSIRLSIYSKRFNIKTMQMVGATKGFIRKPFIWQSIKLGVFGALLASIGIGVLIYYLDKKIPALDLIKDYISLIYLFSGILATAFIITWLSTFFATQRFLNLQTDKLYY
jgi:cell division transport system permease protein